MTWNGKPELRPYFIKSLLDFSGRIGFILFIYLTFYNLDKSGYELESWFIIHGAAMFFGLEGLYSLAKRMYSYKRINYEISNSQIKIDNGGLTGSKKIIDRDKIHFVETKSYISDKLFGTSTVRLYTGEIIDKDDELKKKFDELESVKDANKVVELIRIKI